MMQIICLIFCTVIALINGAPQIEKNVTNLNLAEDLKNWMSLLPSDLKNVPLNLLAIPGSHDSFTVNITKKSKVSPDGEAILKKLEFLTIVKTVMANWSKTQGYNVVQQLEAGIRFFDLRFCYDIEDNRVYFCHGLYSTEVTGVLEEINSYLNSHPQEIVILDCQHFYNFTSTTHKYVVDFIKTTFGNKLIPHYSNNTDNMSALTLRNLISLKQQILVIYRDSVQTEELLLWPTESYPTPWYNTMNVSFLLSNLDKGLIQRSNNIGHVSQLILTPSIEDILKDIFLSLKIKCAEDFENARTEWISHQRPGLNGVNVIIGDFIDISYNNFSKTVINLNQKFDFIKLNIRTKSVSVVERIKRFFRQFI